MNYTLLYVHEKCFIVYYYVIELVTSHIMFSFFCIFAFWQITVLIINDSEVAVKLSSCCVVVRLV